MSLCSGARFDRLDRPVQIGRRYTGVAPAGGEPVAELGEVVEVLRRLPWDVAGHEAAEPVPDVRAVADLAHLAVVDEVDAGVGLLLDRLRRSPVAMTSANVAWS